MVDAVVSLWHVPQIVPCATAAATVHSVLSDGTARHVAGAKNVTVVSLWGLQTVSNTMDLLDLL